MTEPHRPARVGDQVQDGTTGRPGIVTDIQRGIFVLRPLYGPGGPGGQWMVTDPGHLTVTMTSEQRWAEGRI